MITIKNYLDLKKKLKEFDLVYPKTVAILPINLDSAKDKKELFNSDTTTTVRVIWKKAGIIETPIEEKKSIPEFHKESFEWLGPTIFLASTVVAGNPELVEMIVDVISSYLTEWFKGIVKEERKAKLDIITQTKAGSYKDIHYEGDIDGLKELPKIIRSLHDEH